MEIHTISLDRASDKLSSEYMNKQSSAHTHLAANGTNYIMC